MGRVGIGHIDSDDSDMKGTVGKGVVRLTWIGWLCFIVTAFFLWRLVDIPFGFLFHCVVALFMGSLLIGLLGCSLMCFRANRSWLKLPGIALGLFSGILVMLTVILVWDYRILYFRSLSPKPTKTQWAEDLHTLRNQMAEKHRDISALVSETELDETVDAIESRLDRLSDAKIVMELFRLTAMPNDGHTFPFIMFPCFDLHTIPIQVYGFDDGWFVVDAGRENKNLIGSRVVKIGSKPIDDIYASYPLFLSAESEYGRKQRFPYMCMMVEWLFYHDIIEDPHAIPLTLEKQNGETVVRSIPSMNFYPHFLWSSVFEIDSHLAPVFSNPRKDFYRFEHLINALYVQFNQCVNQPGRETMDEFVSRLAAYAEQSEFDRCIIDLRNNDGGNRTWDKLLEFLRDDERINKPGALFVLIGRRTFSSAVMFANQLQMQTHAVFVGEPTGQGPIFYGGPNLVELPHSRLMFAISSHLTISGLPFDTRDAIVPHVPVAYKVDDFLTGQDPVLEMALTTAIPAREVKTVPIDVLTAYMGRYLLNPVQVMDVTVEGASLHISVTDFLPGSLLRFESDLFPESEDRFATRISGMSIELRHSPTGGADQLTLIWQDQQVTFTKAPEGYVLASEMFDQGDIEAGVAAIRANTQAYLEGIPTLENILNGMGYDLMRQENLASALKVFQLNTELYPDSFNTYDSLGEVLLASGDSEGAIRNYRKSLTLYPDSPSGKRALKKLGVEM